MIKNDRIEFLAAYIVGAALIAWMLNRAYRPRRQAAGILLSLWLLAEGIFNSDPFIISLGKGAGFEIQFTRLLFLLFGSILLLDLLGKKRGEPGEPLHLYERVFLVSLVAFAGVLFWHSRSSLLPTKDMILILSGWLTFACFYLIAKHSFDAGLGKVILASLVCIAVASSLVALIQFFVNPEFLRVGSMREAFGGATRSNGVFKDEYTHSYFVIAGLFAALTTIRRRLLRYLVAALSIAGIILSFHRMSWICMLLVLGLVGLFKAQSRSRKLLGWSVSVMAVVLVLVALGADQFLQSNEFVYQRLLSDTMTGRTDVYSVALNRIQKEWMFGVGSPRSDTYYLDMTRAGIREFASGSVGGIHNLYLNMAYMYGIPVALLYGVSLLSLAVFYWRRAHSQYFSFLAAVFATVFLIANLSNWFYPAAEESLLLAIIAGVAAGAQTFDRDQDQEQGGDFFSVPEWGSHRT